MTILHDHDAQPGPLTRCQITGSDNLNLIIDLGHQPPCDSLLTSLTRPEVAYPLALYHCPESGLAQLDYVVPAEEVYPASYPYRSGISKPLEEYQRAFASRVIAKFQNTRPNPLAVDIGSNDGTLLTGFRAAGWRALGVEPTDVADIAETENDICTIKDSFTEDVAEDIRRMYGFPAIVTMTNVFAHMGTLGEVMRGLSVLMNDETVFITESHYLLDVLDKFQFDTIYHEHIRTYSLKALVILFAQYGMEVFDVERGDRYGGNIRAYVARKGKRHVEQVVGELLMAETAVGLHEHATWQRWSQEVLDNRDKTMEFLYTTHRLGFKIAGCSAPGRASTLINFYGMKKEMVRYTGELHNSLKLNKYLPGSHIPVLRNTIFGEDKPDYIILFAWHYAEVITKRLREEGITAKFIKPLPRFEVIE